MVSYLPIEPILIINYGSYLYWKPEGWLVYLFILFNIYYNWGKNDTLHILDHIKLLNNKPAKIVSYHSWNAYCTQ